MDGQMLPGKILPGQMSQWQLEYILDVFMNLPLKFGQKILASYDAWKSLWWWLWWYGGQDQF